MSCRRAFDIDLAAFLAEPRAEAFSAFREHYPRCPACAAEVRVWTELGARLASADVHPEPALLLGYGEDPAGLGPDERLRVSTHLERCASCRDELAALSSRDPGVLEARLPEPPAERRPDLVPLLEPLRRLLWHPGFAYALALLVTAPALYLWVAPGEPAVRDGSAGIAHEERAPAPSAEVAVRTDEGLPEAPLAQERSIASPLEKRDAPERGSVARGTASGATAAGSTGSARAREAAATEPSPEQPARSDPRRPALGRRFAVEREGGFRAAPLRALGYLEPGTPAESEPRVGGPAPTVTLEDLGAGVFALRVPVDPTVREVEIRVVSPDGRRELVQRFGGGASEVALRIPAGWLEPGTQRVESRLDGTTQVFSLEVR